VPTSDLRASLKDLADVDPAAMSDELAARRRADEDALDPIADPLGVALDLDQERTLVSAADVAARLGDGSLRRYDLLGARGAALPFLVARVADATAQPVVVVGQQ